MTGAAVEVERANRRGTLVASPAMRARLAALKPPPPTADSPPPRAAPLAEAPLPAMREKKIIDTGSVPDTEAPIDTVAVPDAGVPDTEASQVDPGVAEYRAAQEQWRAARRERRHRVEAISRERWPGAFRTPRPPLAIGTREKMIEAGIDPDDAAVFLRWWCAKWDYLDAIAHREPRVDLDGTPVALPADRDRYIAAIEVYGQHKAREVLARIDARQAEAAAPAPRQDAENAAD